VNQVSASDSAYRDLASVLSPVAVSKYLAASGQWRLVDRSDDVSEFWALLGDDGELKGRIMLPLATDYADFVERFADTLRAIGIVNSWSAAEVGREPIRLDHAAVATLGRVHERLLRVEEPPHRETLFGHVISLSRDADEDLETEASSVVLSAEVNGRYRNVHMVLTGDYHESAIKAYRLKRPLIVTGDLVFERRAWRLTGDIDVDTRLLDRDHP
jgi:hypothetical protein